MRTSSFVILLLLSLFLIKLSQTPAEADMRTGGWSRIKNLSDPDVVDIARFALSEHNRLQANSKPELGLSRVVKGEEQLVAGTMYKLVIAASDGKRYEAMVWEKVWEHFRKLTSFKLVNK